MKVSPFLPLFPFVPPLLRQAGRVWHATLPADALRANALDLAVLTGHLVLYPAGIVQERRAEPLPPETAQLPTEGRAHPPSSCSTASSTTGPSSSCCAAPWPGTAGPVSYRSTTRR